MEKLEAVIFDFDGTIVDTEKIYYENMADLTKEYLGETLDKMDYIENVSGTNEETSRKYYKDKYGMTDEAYDKFEEEITQRIIENYHNASVLPGIKETMQYLYSNGIKMAVASNGKEEHIRTGLERKGFEKYIEAIATKIEVENPKPAPDVYLLAAEKLGVDIKNTIAIEDSRPGALGASKSGATLILQTNDITKYMDFSGIEYNYRDINLLEVVKSIVEDM
ncbi:HAD family hydrolase [Gemella cuniculi]|uniref:HAD family hydrolase n=1 Tax=Gemella cuniculi TaxID=150240 RepID=UPI000409DC04|nr:HAD family phosphatase [Gemella cuniculi]